MLSCGGIYTTGIRFRQSQLCGYLNSDCIKQNAVTVRPSIFQPASFILNVIVVEPGGTDSATYGSNFG